MASATALFTAPVVIAPGKVLDFVDGVTQRNDTPEEYVRQEIAKSLVREYQYSKDDIEVEFPIKFGSRRVRVDIAIFPPGKQHTQNNIQIVIECKKPGTSPKARKDGVEQLFSYISACPNVRYGMWTNGSDLESYKVFSASDGHRTTEGIPDIPHFGDESEADRPSFDQLRAAASDSLLFAFRRSHDYIAGNQGLQKPEAFWELLKLIFCKIHDERTSDRPTFYATPSERKTLTGAIKCRNRISSLFESVKKLYPTIFRAGEEIELENTVLAYIVTQLQMFSLLESDVDVKGKAYEEIVGSNLRGDRGEFFTPRNICTMMISMVNPSDRDVILDPACGTGGFLITAMNHVLQGINDEVSQSGRSMQAQQEAELARRRVFLESNLIGIDFNPNLVRATKMNMVMNNDGSGRLFAANSLAPFATWPEDLRAVLAPPASSGASSSQGANGSERGVDIIVTNPPFGSKIPIDDPSILEQFDLGHKWSYLENSDEWVMGSETSSRPPEILFIERCVDLLKPGSGIAAMVLPDGILGSPGLGFVREWLIAHTQILASIDLHADTFQPGTSVQTSVLIVRRKSEEEMRTESLSGQIADYDVFMAICDHIGHDKRGNATYVRDENGFEVVAETAGAITGALDPRRHEQVYASQERVRDDNTQEIAEAYQAWLTK